MRVGFLGNQNNYPFILARALRRAGHDVRVVIDQRDPLDRPECRYADVSYPYPEWIRELSETPQFADIVHGSARWQAALDAVRDCDALVLNRWAFDAATRLPLPAFCLTTGADVELFSHPRGPELWARTVTGWPRARGWVRAALATDRIDRAGWTQVVDRAPAPVYRAWQKRVFRRFVDRQRAGLRRAVGINAFPDRVSQPLAEVIADCLAPATPRCGFLMADIEWITVRPAPHNPVLRLFNAARLLWKRPFPPTVGEWENKGTDVLLEGIALWHRRTGQPLDVHLVEKGPSIEATRALVDALGIARLVTWHREMTQREVFDEYARADIVSEQCGDHVLGMAGYEAMAAGRPVLANGRPEIFTSVFGAPPPIAQARTPEEIAAQLERLADPFARTHLAAQGRAFVETHLSPDTAARTVATILEHAIAARRGRDPVMSSPVTTGRAEAAA